MCGITGAISLTDRPLVADRFKPMVDIIAHRGPDDAGYLVWHTGLETSSGDSFGQSFSDSQFERICPWLPVLDSHGGQHLLQRHPWDLFFGHRRLSIIDLSYRAHQPMCDNPQNYWLIYNGEIYNFPEIQQELKAAGHEFHSDSDTEVIIHAYQQWGIDCIHKFNGIFAFALFDSLAKKVWLARDRYGIKPLYYTLTDDGTFLFGSEIRSIREYLTEKPGVNLTALNEYFSFQNIFGDYTLFSGINLLPNGHYIEIDLSRRGSQFRRALNIAQYWDFDFSRSLSLPESQLEDELYDLLTRAVRRQCLSDVPVGSYLSGGLDSGTVTGVATSVLGRLSTFTMGFDLSEAAQHEMRFDERELAEYMANEFQTEHYECVLHSGDMEAVMRDLVWHLEDLRVGQSYPNYYIARLASKFVKVVLSGMGGDELFGGYPWRYAAAMGDGHAGYIENYYTYWQRLVRDHEKLDLFNPVVLTALQANTASGAESLRERTLQVFRDVFPDNLDCKTPEDQINNSLYFECKTFLHGLLLIEDKISMAHSLEMRVPLLDNDLVDFACQVPILYKIRDFHHLQRFNENVPTVMAKRSQMETTAGKNILRNAMGRVIPAEVAKAKKQGFSAPDESWFRGRSEGYVRSMLLDRKARINEYLNPAYVKKMLDKHQAGDNNERLLIWSLLSFEWWLRIFMD